MSPLLALPSCMHLLHSDASLLLAALVPMQGLSAGGQVWTSNSVLKSCHSALQAHYQRCQVGEAARKGRPKGQRQLQDDVGYKQVYDECKACFKVKRGQPLPGKMDPHDNTQQATFSMDEHFKICAEAAGSPDPLVARDLSQYLACTSMCGRGDDARERRLCELCEPRLRASIGA
jgi:hypothetical protein